MLEKQYAWSYDIEEEFSCRLGSIKECFDEAISDGCVGGDTIYIGEAKDIELDYYFDADEFVYNLLWHNDIEDDSVTGKEINDLRIRVEKVIEDWLDELDIGKSRFNVVNVKEYVVPAW